MLGEGFVVFFNLLLYMFISLKSESHKRYLTHTIMTEEKKCSMFSPLKGLMYKRTIQRERQVLYMEFDPYVEYSE